MPSNSPKSPKNRFSRQGFQPLDGDFRPGMATYNSTEAIPLQSVVTHSPYGGGQHGSAGGMEHQATFKEKSPTEKSGLFRRHAGKRKLAKLDSRGQPVPHDNDDEDETRLTRMGLIYNKILHFSIFTRYFLYVLPLALCIAVPIIVGATAAKGAMLGGVRIVWVFTWVEIGRDKPPVGRSVMAANDDSLAEPLGLEIVRSFLAFLLSSSHGRRKCRNSQIRSGHQGIGDAAVTRRMGSGFAGNVYTSE